jgi:DNA-binding transcriptional ArsR family regulator
VGADSPGPLPDLGAVARGPSTASRLARRLGYSRGSISYHVRYLAHAGVVEELPNEGTARERWWRRPDPPLIGETREDPESQEIGARMLGMFFARDDDVRRRFVTGPVSADWQRGAFVGNWLVALTPEEADELGRCLFAIVDDLRRRRDAPPGAEQALVTVSVLPVLDGAGDQRGRETVVTVPSGATRRTRPSGPASST